MVADRSEDDPLEMASERSKLDPFQSEWAWRAGALAGVVAAVAVAVAVMAVVAVVIVVVVAVAVASTPTADESRRGGRSCAVALDTCGRVREYNCPSVEARREPSSATTALW